MMGYLAFCQLQRRATPPYRHIIYKIRWKGLFDHPFFAGIKIIIL